jgi:hypothetical protein
VGRTTGGAAPEVDAEWTTLEVDAEWPALEVGAEWPALEVDAERTALEADAEWTALEVDAEWTALEVDAEWTALDAGFRGEESGETTMAWGGESSSVTLCRSRGLRNSKISWSGAAPRITSFSKWTARWCRSHRTVRLRSS